MADTPLKFKRGQELNVGNLPLEDGSVIFSTRDTTSPTTVRVDVQVNDTLQRLGLGVSSASSANTASTATRLRTARKINDGSFDGTADVSITELRPIIITDQTLDLNTLRLDDSLVGKKLYLCGTDGGSANITNRPTTTNQGFSLLVEQLKWYNGTTDYVTKQTLEYRDSHQVWVRYSNGSAWGSWTLQSTGGIASTASYSQNSGALGGSSLTQVLSQSGSGNAFTGLSGSGSSTLHFTRANGGTVNFIVNNVALATLSSTANYAKNSSALGGSTLSQIVTMAGGGSAYTGVDTAINSTIRLYRANGSTSTKIINNVAHASSASIATSASISTSATRLNTFKNLFSTSTDNTSNWKSYGNSVVLYNGTRLTDQPQGWGLVASFTGDDEVHQIFMDQPSGSLYHRSGNSSGWWKTWTELLDTSNFATYTTKFVTKDELGSDSSTGTINVDAARRIINSDINTRNAQSFRVGTPGSGSWTGFPSSYLYSSSSTAALKTNAYYRNQVGVLHVAAGTAYHDLVFADAGTDNGIVRVSSKGDTGLILDTTNYATYSTRYNALSSSTLTVTTAGGVNIDGGSY